MGRDPKPKSTNNRTKMEGGPVRKTKLGFNDYRFVRIELDQEQRNHFKALQTSNEFEEFEALDQYLGGGYKASFNKDPNGGGVICAVSCSSPDDPNHGLILTGRGATAPIAWNVFRFKTLYLCEDEIWATGERGSGVNDDVG